MADTTPLPEPKSHVQLGRIVEGWARDPKSIPSDQTVLRAMVEEATGQLPARIKKISVVCEDLETLVIKIPPAEMLDAGRMQVSQAGAGGGGYPLRSEYEKQVNRSPLALPLENFFLFRVGEYSIQQCK